MSTTLESSLRGIALRRFPVPPDCRAVQMGHSLCRKKNELTERLHWKLVDGISRISGCICIQSQERLVWLLDHSENELWKQPPDPVLEAVAKMVSDENREWEGSPTELAEALRLDMAVNRLLRFECECQPPAGRTSGEVRKQNQAYRTAYPADLHGDRSTYG